MEHERTMQAAQACQEGTCEMRMGCLGLGVPGLARIALDDERQVQERICGTMMKDLFVFGRVAARPRTIQAALCFRPFDACCAYKKGSD